MLTQDSLYTRYGDLYTLGLVKSETISRTRYYNCPGTDVISDLPKVTQPAVWRSWGSNHRIWVGGRKVLRTWPLAIPETWVISNTSRSGTWEDLRPYARLLSGASLLIARYTESLPGEDGCHGHLSSRPRDGSLLGEGLCGRAGSLSREDPHQSTTVSGHKRKGSAKRMPSRYGQSHLGHIHQMPLATHSQ